MSLKRRDVDQWMSHRCLPQDLRRCAVHFSRASLHKHVHAQVLLVHMIVSRIIQSAERNFGIELLTAVALDSIQLSFLPPPNTYHDGMPACILLGHLLCKKFQTKFF